MQLLAFQIGMHVCKHFLRLGISLLFFTPTFVIAQNQQSSCISTHFHQFHGPSGSVKVISIERLKKWSAWCQQGYNAQKLAQAITPCFQQTLTDIRSKNNNYIPISFKKTEKIKAYCKQQFWQEITFSENNNNS